MEDSTLFGMTRGKSPIALARQQERYQQQAERWQAWWEAHCRSAPRTKRMHASIFRRPKSLLFRRSSCLVRPRRSTVSSQAARCRRPTKAASNSWTSTPASSRSGPNTFPKTRPPNRRRNIALWAAQHGVDLMCVVYRSPDGTETFALRAFNMRLWEISLRDAEELEELVKRGKLPEGKPAGELLLHRDEQTGNYVPEANAAFLYATPKGASA